MLKRALAGVSALVLLGCGAASAADLATRYPVKAVAPVVPMFSWTGFYLGGHAGYAWSNNTYSVYDATFATTYDYNLGSGDSWVLGLQGGYNYQFANNVVLGLEADISWTGIGGGGNYIAAGPLFGTTSSLGGDLDYYGTIRARLGYAFDRWLPYVTGGAAWGHVNNGTFYGQDTSSTNWGWTVGAGVEYAITNNFTARLEYLYIDLDGNKYSDVFTGDSLSTSLDMSVLRVGVNYKF
ncbi:outer membrane protein [Xanthobacteraceae bacterium A53D]